MGHQDSMLDWSRLKTYQNTKFKSLEELCYQLAKRLYGDRGDFTSIDDSGGGDGVEFYLTLADGEQWGWQAKFYWPNPRLNAGRKRSILDSFRTSKANHPRLRRWFLCTPTSFTSHGKGSEATWFAKTLGEAAGSINIEHWDDRTIHEYLTRPEMAGIRKYFFGELEVSPLWFRNHIQRQIANVSNRYLPAVHVVSGAESRMHNLLGDESCSVEFNGHLEMAKGHIRKANAILDRLSTPGTGWLGNNDWGRRLAESAQLLGDSLRKCSGKLEVLGPSNIRRFSAQQISQLDEMVKRCVQHYSNAISAIRQDSRRAREPGSTVDRETYVNENLLREYFAPFKHLSEVETEIQSLTRQLEDFESGILHYFGVAGIGKTQLCAHLVETLTNASLPALFFLGRSFSRNQTIEKRMMEELDVPANYSWSDFLGALEAYSESRGHRVLLVIDGLNETHDPKVWHDEFGGFLATLRSYDGLAIATTCRPSYRDLIFGDQNPSRSTYLQSFQNEELDTLTASYFAYYLLKADLTFASLKQFSNPLYLRLFCEVQNPSRQFERELYVGEQDMFTVFDTYLKLASEEVARRADKPNTDRILLKLVDELAEQLWREGRRTIAFCEAIELFDGRSFKEVEWSRSLTKATLDVELVLARDASGDNETIGFTFDMFGGYVIAKHLLRDKGSVALTELLESEETRMRLVGDDYLYRHPLHEDILRAICALAPTTAGVYLYNLAGAGYFGAAIEALFEMNPRYIGSEQVALIERLFTVLGNDKKFLHLFESTAFNQAHPLNMHFQTRLLRSMSLVERDLAWTEHIRAQPEQAIDILDRFVRACVAKRKLNRIDQQRLVLVALYVTWLLTSTTRRLRDRATRALTVWGRRFPSAFVVLVLASLEINDPYVPERTIAAAYGVAMLHYGNPKRQKYKHSVLPRFAREIFQAFFVKGALHSTSHALTRDYARHLLELAVLGGPGILTAVEVARIRPPFEGSGIRRWGRSKDRNEGEYRDGNNPLGRDFANYTLGTLVPGRNTYDFLDSGYLAVKEKILWRVYQLGYSLNKFGELDKEIARSSWNPNSNESNETRTDKYGKKYAWIAFFELYGNYQDKGILRDKWSFEPKGRPSDVDIDPSFPGRPPKVRIWDGDPFENSPLDCEDWVKDDTCPNFTSLFSMLGIAGNQGPWDLLNGRILTLDADKKRAFFVDISTVLVPGRDVGRLKRLLKTCPLQLDSVWNLPDSHYIFAGEVPWADVFPANALSTLEFIIGTELRNVPTFGAARGVDGSSLKLKKSYQMQEVNLIESISVCTPVHEINWGPTHSGANIGQSVLIPSRAIAESADLRIRPRTWQLDDKAGKIGSLSTAWRDGCGRSQEFLYLRSDLLAAFCLESDYVAFRSIRGQRRIYWRQLEIIESKGKLEHAYSDFSASYLGAKKVTAKCMIEN